MMKLNFLFIIFLMANCLRLTAQMILPEQIMAKYIDGKILIKWEPQTIDEWRNAQMTGYTVEQYIVSNGSEKLLKTKKIKQANSEEWKKAMMQTSKFKYDFYRGGRNLLYPELAEGDLDNFLSAIRVKSDQTIDSFKLNFVSYVSLYDFNICQLAGLGAEFDAQEGVQYAFKVFNNPSDIMKKELHAIESDHSIAPLEAQFDNRVVHLKWNSFVNNKDYYGYFIEKSNDGLRYTLKDSIPYINNLDKKEGASQDVHFIKVNDSLDQNYVTRYYRIRGMDYFGDPGKSVSTISGYGFDKLTVSPMLNFAEQTEDNKAHLKWELHNAPDNMVKDFSILRADSIDGNYKVVMAGIDKASREARVPMEHETNFFRIEVNPTKGEPLTSMPVFVMGMDTIPPATPVLISAILDTLGRVKITWKKNKESDLWGYRLFTANFKDEEFALLNATPILDTMYYDSLDLKFDTEKRFYTILAADKRNNRSQLAEPIFVTKPDLTPPAMPNIVSAEQNDKGVLIKWIGSSSPDVVNHKLYKRPILQKNGWDLIAVIDTTMKDKLILDTLVSEGGVYAYTLVAYDDGDNESKPAPLRQCEIKPIKKILDPFSKISIVKDSLNNRVTIQWECNDAENISSVLVYKGESKERMAKLVYIEAPETTFSEVIGTAETYYYSLKPNYKVNGGFYVSDIIEVKGEMNEK